MSKLSREPMGMDAILAPANRLGVDDPAWTETAVELIEQMDEDDMTILDLDLMHERVVNMPVGEALRYSRNEKGTGLNLEKIGMLIESGHMKEVKPFQFAMTWKGRLASLRG